MADAVDGAAVACVFALVAVFCAAAVGKLGSIATFRETVAAIDFVPSSLIRPIAVGVPLVEALGAGLLLVAPRLGAAVIAGLLIVLMFVAVRLQRRGRTVTCSCFGALQTGELGSATIARNAVLLAASVLVLTKGMPSSSDALPLALVGITAALVLLALEELLPDARRGADETLALLEQQERPA